MNKKTTAKKGKKKKAAKRARPAPKKRKAKRQNPGKAPRRTAKTCKVKGCNKKVYARGMCGQHFMAWVRSKKK